MVNLNIRGKSYLIFQQTLFIQYGHVDPLLCVYVLNDNF